MRRFAPFLEIFDHGQGVERRVEHAVQLRRDHDVAGREKVPRLLRLQTE